MLNRIILVIVAVTALCGSCAWGAVNLDWRPAQQTVTVGSEVDLGLYATATNEGQTISAMDVILSWDPSLLRLEGLGDMQPMWFNDGMMDFAPDGLNDSWDDGSVMYSAFGNFGDTIVVPQDGMLCVMFQFTALAPSSGANLSILPTYGDIAETKVFDGIEPNLGVNGTLGQASVTVEAVPEPSSLIGLALGAIPMLALRRRRIR